MDQPSINLNLGNDNTGVSLTAVQNFGPSLESDIQGAVRDLERDIGRYSLPAGYTQKLEEAERVFRRADLATLVDWMDCRRKPNTAEPKVRALLCFLVNAMLVDEHLAAPPQGGTKTILRGRPAWLFQIPRGEAEPLALHLTDMIQLFQKLPDCEIRNGTAFLARLSQSLTCEVCIGDGLDTACVRGVVRDWLMGNTGADLEGNGQIADFFAQLEPRDLTIKCGNCIVDVQRTEQVRQVLGGEQ